MKQIIYILLAIVAGIALGRLSIGPKVVTETVTEYHALNTSALAPIKVSEPIGTKSVMLRKNLFPNIDQVTDVKEDDFPMIEQTVTDSNAFVTAELPIRDYTFTDDSTYTITARGVYVESLPQIEFRQQVTTTRSDKISRPTRIEHGLQMGGGLALTPKGLQPAIYVGYGLTIKF